MRLAKDTHDETLTILAHTMTDTDMNNNKVQSGTVLVLGSLHYDVMIEAPHRPSTGETVTGQRWYPKFGGKGGNQAVACKLHGAQVRFVSATGSDNFADYLHEYLAQVGISTEYVPRLESIGSGMSVAIQDVDGDYGAVIVSGANLVIPAGMLDRESLWAGSSMLLLQNEVPEVLNLIAAEHARKRQIPVCLNAAPVREISAGLADKIDIIIVNSVEAQALGGGVVDSLDAAEKAANTLSQHYSTVIVTAGSDGVAMASDSSDSIKLPAKQIDVISTHGAGDVFTGTLCAELVAGTSLQNAVEIANDKAAIHVST